MFKYYCIKSAPTKPAIYFLFDNNKELIYLGITCNLRRRLLEHKRIKDFSYFRYNIIYNKELRVLLEDRYIHMLYPKLNWQKRIIEIDEENYDKTKYEKLGRWIYPI